ncbi:MAG: hypothetical protein CMB56_001550 [Methanobacteriota archaeon]|nr:MAG: hypothetical protein CMB56_001550 [Euryarchaeota archaeon]|tara:strand:- start:1246 stop:2253 length:1008 start_codon:yes stop_codon:yes gene_type:complete
MALDEIKIGLLKEFDDGSQSHFRRLMDTYDVDFIEFNSQDELIESLIEGEIDLIGTSGIRALELGFSGTQNLEGLKISTFLPRRDPTLVLVSKDNLEYLHKNAKIFTNSNITKLQLKRFRTDFQILDEIDLNLDMSSKSELIEMLDQLCDENNLDAYVIERSEWNEFKNKGRRRSLGMQIGKGYSRPRFIPPPLRGFSILISRLGFPNSILGDLDDSQARICFNVESNLTQQLGKIDFIGLNASIRRISTISKSLSEDGGFSLEILDEKLTDLQRFDNDFKDLEQMVEVIVESLDSSGKVTCGLEKKFVVGDDEFRILKIFVEEWNKIIDLTFRD